MDYRDKLLKISAELIDSNIELLKLLRELPIELQKEFAPAVEVSIRTSANLIKNIK